MSELLRSVHIAQNLARRFWAICCALFIVLVFESSISARSTDPEHPLVYRVAPREFRVSQSETVSTKLMVDGEMISIKTEVPGEAISIDLGPFEVQPGTVYRANVGVELKGAEGSAGVSLMIREHPETGAAPVTPYHRTPVGERPLQVGSAEKRELNFITRGDSGALSVVIVVTDFSGELQLSKFDLSLGTPTGKPMKPEEAMADFEKMMDEIRAAADARKPLVPRPLVYSRSQMKYPLGRNYYHEWNDRPLLVNRKYRVESPYPTPLLSYERTLEEVKKYDIDGLAFFPETATRTRMFEAHEKAKVEGVGLLTEFLPMNDAEAIAEKIAILKIALAHPATPRIDGKVLVTSYAASSLSPGEWKTLLDALRKEVGDTFLFLPSLANVATFRKEFMAGEPVSRAEIEKEREVLRTYLDVCDGIYFNYPAAFKRKDHSFDEAFYRDIFIPIFKSVLSEPVYRKKYLGLSAYRSHMSPERGNSLREDGTRTLRRSFEAAMEARPDVLILPEWDEENENTSFRPTLYGGRTSARIIRYYMSRLKEKDPTPIPGDDLEVPNLILSSRKAVTLGEEAIFELLNVPDSSDLGNYTVELKLENPAGKVVHSFPVVEFHREQLQEHRFSFPTETYPDLVALIPTLKIRGYKDHEIEYENGFHHVAIRATWNWDHLFVKQPLRDLLRPDKVTFSAASPHEGNDDGSFLLSGSVVSPERLTLVEVLGDDDEVYAVDPTDEFFRNNAEKELFSIEFRSINTRDIKGRMILNHARANWLSNGPPLQIKETDPEHKSQEIELNRPASVHQRWIYLAIRQEDVAKAVLSFEVENEETITVPVREIVEKKMVGYGLDGGIHLSIKPYRRQIDMPVSLDSHATDFQVRVWPEITTEQFHLRLTSESGRIYRSRPLTVPGADSATKQTLRIFSEAQQKPLDVEVAGNRIPSLDYEFIPLRGAVLLTDEGRPFWGTLGGFSNSTTGRGTVNGLYGSKYPTEVKRSDPAWVRDENGTPCLEFDGEGTFLELPREALPSRGAFTLSFDVKPKPSADQYLFINGAVTRQHGLALQIQDGKLQASFRDADWVSHLWQTELPVPPGGWSSIRVRADFENIFFTVDDETRSFPLTLPAFNIGFTVFGANWKGNAFEGQLRHLRIEHNSHGETQP